MPWSIEAAVSCCSICRFRTLSCQLLAVSYRYPGLEEGIPTAQRIFPRTIASSRPKSSSLSARLPSHGPGKNLANSALLVIRWAVGLRLPSLHSSRIFSRR